MQKLTQFMLYTFATFSYVQVGMGFLFWFAFAHHRFEMRYGVASPGRLPLDFLLVGLVLGVAYLMVVDLKDGAHQASSLRGRKVLRRRVAYFSAIVLGGLGWGMLLSNTIEFEVTQYVFAAVKCSIATLFVLALGASRRVRLYSLGAIMLVGVLWTAELSTETKRVGMANQVQIAF